MSDKNTHRKKLLHFQLVPILSGPQNMMFHLLDALSPADYDIYVMAQPGRALSDEVTKHGYTYIPLTELRHPIHYSDLRVFLQIIRIFRKYQFDIVHTHSSKPGLLGRIAARIAGVPLIIHTGHGAPFHYGQTRFTYRFFVGMEKFGALFGDHLVFVNHYLKDYYVRHKMIPAKKVSTLYNALSTKLIDQLTTAAKDRESRAPLTLSLYVTIGAILRFTTAKNIVMTIQAAIHICLLRDDVRFIFVGDGEFFSLCQKMVATHRLQDRIRLTGWMDKPADQYALFDAFLLYSIFEGLPMCIIEAMYASLPIIGSDIPSIAELVDDSNGWLIPSDNLSVLEASLHKIIDDRELFTTKGRAGRLKAEQLCSHQRFVQGYKALYDGEKV
jgi:glycosyltransferase involved in cell wall biosynthesis